MQTLGGETLSTSEISPVQSVSREDLWKARWTRKKIFLGLGQA